MSLKDELADMLTHKDRILETLPGESLSKLSEEDQEALRWFFAEWVKGLTIDEFNKSYSLKSLVALGFILGHNWVKEHWALW